jgi:hypothetical protein
MPSKGAAVKATIEPHKPEPAGVQAVRTAALAALAAGMSVVPPRQDGSKAPDREWTRYQAEPPTRDQVERWYRAGRTGLGVVCGRVSGGLELLEFETDEVYRDFVAAARATGLGDLVNLIEAGYLEETPGGGRHWLYRCSQVDGNTRLARRPATAEELAVAPDSQVRVLIETRGEGGFVVLAPSNGRVHPTGRPYRLLRGSFDRIWHLTTAERAALFRLARAFDQMPAPPPPEASAERHGQPGGRPGDDYNERASWAEILGPHGWTLVHRRGDVEFWRRPGKRDPGHSATVGHVRDSQGGPALYVFSSSTPFESERSYTKFGACAVLNHGGDHGAAARELRARGYGDAPQNTHNPRNPTGSWPNRDSANTAATLPSSESSGAGLGSADSADSADWEPPTPLRAAPALPTFPIDALPDWLAGFVRAEAIATQTPLDLPAMLVVAALATACGGLARIQIRPGWIEPLNLFIAVALPPASRKSAVFADVTRPLTLFEQSQVKRMKVTIAQETTAKKVAERAAEHAQNAAGKTDPTRRDQLLAEAQAAAAHAAAIQVPPIPRLLADDATPEALTSLLADHRRIALLSAEGGVFEMMAGRYQSSGPNLDVYLKGHAGDELRVDRKGRPPEFVARPALTVGLAVQPDVLRTLRDRPGFRGRGLLARFLYVLPENTVGRRQIGPPSVPEDVVISYWTAVQILCNTLLTESEAVLQADPDGNGLVIGLSDEAAALLRAFEAEIEPRLAEDTGDLAHMADWAGKLVGATARIAGLLHLAEQIDFARGAPVDVGAVNAAILIARYLLDHALAAFDFMGADPALDDARYILAWTERGQVGRFTRRELFTALPRGRFPKVADLEPPLGILEAHGYLRRIEPEREPGRPGRRPSTVFFVNPLSVDAGPPNPQARRVAADG